MNDTSAAPRTYPSLDAFYDDRGGRMSGECDFGVGWTRPGHGWPTWRVSVVHDTGDVYARVNGYGADARVVLLGTVGSPCAVSLVNRPHGPACPYEAAERVLTDWAHHMHDLASLMWITARLGVRW